MNIYAIKHSYFKRDKFGTKTKTEDFLLFGATRLLVFKNRWCVSTSNKSFQVGMMLVSGLMFDETTNWMICG